MTTKIETDGDRPSPHWLKTCFYATAILFNLCLIAQLLTVGIAYFSDPTWWAVHVWLVRGYSGLSLVLLAGALAIPCSNRVRSLTASLPVLLSLRFCTIHLKTPFHLEIFHPVIGFALLYVSTSLVHTMYQPSGA